ncbi:MAG: glycosyltransferase family 2 protein [Thiomargarita sp.]|nr:glycosyltransferase family 2 protein [Thiomargarita sp.]
MNLLQRLKRIFSNQHKNIIPQFDKIIENKLPASALLGKQQEFISATNFYGNIPVTLSQGICIRFQLIPHEENVTGIRLRFGTYCRINHCHINIQINQFNHSFNASDLVDNEYINIPFTTPQTYIPKQKLEISIYSTDATAENVVALWCSRIPPVFVNQLKLNPIIFPITSKPQVSIIIPVFNKALYTYNCLLALQTCDTEISREIIIINNASTDETDLLLKQLQGTIKVINNTENKGFVEACKQGADIASGEFILFLNNDTQVMSAWLSNMLEAMNNSKVGITGSKLIYPDGRLQEAGGIIFNDASGWNYGRLQDPSLPQFNQSRAVDYCSGASLMIRRHLWEQLGGFDSRYAPAYYEDTDLCFAARQAGYQVLYCHNSELIHHEGITAGTDINTGYKAFQEINHTKFMKKWQDVLITHFPAGTSPETAIARLSAN